MIKDGRKRSNRAPEPEQAHQCDEEDCECGAGGPPPGMMVPINQDQNELDMRGIIVVNQAISKPGLARATERLLCLHFDEDFDGEIQIILNSPGGYVDAGWAFIDLMGWVRCPIRTIAVGEICSMATAIFVAGDYRVMTANSTAMIHQFSAYSGGTYSDLVANRKSEDMEHDKNIQHLIENSKYTTRKDVEEKLLLHKDNWLSPAEMKAHGLSDTTTKKRGKASEAKKKSLRKTRKPATKKKATKKKARKK